MEYVVGNLTLNRRTDRYCVRLDLESFSSDFHCGDEFEIRKDNQWVPVRIEYNSSWYLVGAETDALEGTLTRIVKV